MRSPTTTTDLPLLLLLTSLGAQLTTASPLVLDPRAGGPAYVPITPPCHLTTPLPPSTPSTSYRPSTALTKTHEIYSWDRPAGDAAYVNTTTLWRSCVEQCNGLAGCHSAYLAYGVPSEPRYGAPGGEAGIGCRMYDVKVGKGDFVRVELEANGTRAYERARVGVIGGEGCAK